MASFILKRPLSDSSNVLVKTSVGSSATGLFTGIGDVDGIGGVGGVGYEDLIKLIKKVFNLLATLSTTALSFWSPCT